MKGGAYGQTSGRKTTTKTKDVPGGGWNDDAVWGHLGAGPGHNLTAVGWTELIDPKDDISLDMAFVITPEPATLVVLTLCLIPVLLRRRMKA